MKKAKKDDIYILSDWEIKLLEKADEDLANGRVYTNDEVFARTDKWLKEKENQLKANNKKIVK